MWFLVWLKGYSIPPQYKVRQQASMRVHKPTWKETLGLTVHVAFSILLMLSAAFTGTVLFSITTLWPSDTAAPIERAAASIYLRSAALPCQQTRAHQQTSNAISITCYMMERWIVPSYTTWRQLCRQLFGVYNEPPCFPLLYSYKCN